MGLPGTRPHCDRKSMLASSLSVNQLCFSAAGMSTHNPPARMAASFSARACSTCLASLASADFERSALPSSELNVSSNSFDWSPSCAPKPSSIRLLNDTPETTAADISTIKDVMSRAAGGRRRARAQAHAVVAGDIAGGARWWCWWCATASRWSTLVVLVVRNGKAGMCGTVRTSAVGLACDGMEKVYSYVCFSCVYSPGICLWVYSLTPEPAF
jgi:hypothetical protein